jgi:hypothetical protein
LITSGFETSEITRVRYGEGIFIACGTNGKIARSTDGGVTWGAKVYGDAPIQQPYGSDGWFAGIAYHEDDRRWIITGYLYSDASGIIATSDWLEAGSGIVEVGENSNGYYVRFSNGIQITFSSSNVGQNTWASRTLPAAHIDTAYIVSGSMAGGDKNTWAVRNLTTTALDVNYTSTATQVIHLITVGYWR